MTRELRADESGLPMLPRKYQVCGNRGRGPLLQGLGHIRVDIANDAYTHVAGAGARELRADESGLPMLPRKHQVCGNRGHGPLLQECVRALVGARHARDFQCASNGH